MKERLLLLASAVVRQALQQYGMTDRTGSGIFNPVLHVQMQVQVLPVATATMLVCKYVVKYHRECFDFACVQVVHT